MSRARDFPTLNWFLLFLIPLLILISFLSFLLMHAAPGGPFDAERKPASPEIERNLRAKYHLDEPIGKQYLRDLGVGIAFHVEQHHRHAPALG